MPKVGEDFLSSHDASKLDFGSLSFRRMGD